MKYVYGEIIYSTVYGEQRRFLVHEKSGEKLSKFRNYRIAASFYSF